VHPIVDRAVVSWPGLIRAKPLPLRMQGSTVPVECPLIRCGRPVWLMKLVASTCRAIELRFAVLRVATPYLADDEPGMPWSTHVSQRTWRFEQSVHVALVGPGWHAPWVGGTVRPRQQLPLGFSVNRKGSRICGRDDQPIGPPLLKKIRSSRWKKFRPSWLFGGCRSHDHRFLVALLPPVRGHTRHERPCLYELLARVIFLWLDGVPEVASTSLVPGETAGCAFVALEELATLRPVMPCCLVFTAPSWARTPGDPRSQPSSPGSSF